MAYSLLSTHTAHHDALVLTLISDHEWGLTVFCIPGQRCLLRCSSTHIKIKDYGLNNPTPRDDKVAEHLRKSKYLQSSSRTGPSIDTAVAKISVWYVEMTFPTYREN